MPLKSSKLSKPASKAPAGKVPLRTVAPAAKAPMKTAKAAAPVAKAKPAAPAAKVNKREAMTQKFLKTTHDNQERGGIGRIKFQEGTTYVRLIDGEFEQSWAHFIVIEGKKKRYNCPAEEDRAHNTQLCPICYLWKQEAKNEYKPKHLLAFNAIEGAIGERRAKDGSTARYLQWEDEVKIMEVGEKIFDGITTIQAESTPGEEVDKIFLKIVRKGTGQTDTTYTVLNGKPCDLPEGLSEGYDLKEICAPSTAEEICAALGIDQSEWDEISAGGAGEEEETGEEAEEVEEAEEEETGEEDEVEETGEEEGEEETGEEDETSEEEGEEEELPPARGKSKTPAPAAKAPVKKPAAPVKAPIGKGKPGKKSAPSDDLDEFEALTVDELEDLM